eukprot:scaffold104604_cov52-Prasinocladus_malaysianus.AAC.3
MRGRGCGIGRGVPGRPPAAQGRAAPPALCAPCWLRQSVCLEKRKLPPLPGLHSPGRGHPTPCKSRNMRLRTFNASQLRMARPTITHMARERDRIAI